MKLLSLIIDGQEAVAESCPIDLGSPKFCTRHTPCPSAYLAWHSWAARMSKAHAQIRCPDCGKWAIWLPKAEARIVNLKDRQEERRFLEEDRKREIARAKARVAALQERTSGERQQY